jgi:transcriptional regulator with XRE-family HTH domain
MKETVYIGETIKKLRKDFGITQEELAYRSEIDRSYISELERNLKSPSLYITLKLAKGFGLEPWEFLNEIDNNIPFMDKCIDL